MMAAAPIDAEGNLDYKGLAYIITHGENKDDEEESQILGFTLLSLTEDNLGPNSHSGPICFILNSVQ